MALICRLNLNLTWKSGIKFGAKSRAGKNSTLKFTSKEQASNLAPTLTIIFGDVLIIGVWVFEI